MSKVCEICEKRPISGNNISHAHNKTRRRWLPNLKSVRVDVNGNARRMKVCTTCIKQGRIRKAA